MTPAQTPSNWELAADDLVSVLLNDQYGRERIIYDLNVMPAHMPSIRHRRLYEAVRDCMAAGEPIHDTTIREKCGTVVPLDWLAQCAALYDPSRLGALDSNARIVRKHGMNAGTRNILKLADDELVNGKGHDAVIPRLMTALTALDSSNAVTGETADAMAGEFSDLMNGEPPVLLSSGLRWLDQLSGGFDRGHIWWLAAPYKSRKSTVMLNIALGMLMTWFTLGCAGEPPSIGIGSAEMPRRRINAQLIAMLSVAYIRQRHWWQERFMLGATAFPLHMISADALLKARSGYRGWDRRRVEAIDYGISQFREFGRALRVYDRTPDGGSLTDLKQLFTVMRRDKHLYGTNVFFVDYLQLFKSPDAKLFDFVSSAALELQKFAAVEGITLVVLAQQNEETIRSGTTYSAGIKGGGDPAATADYLLTSLYKSGELASDDTKIELTMKLSRHGTGGGDTKRALDIHPASGLLLDCDWIGRI